MNPGFFGYLKVTLIGKTFLFSFENTTYYQITCDDHDLSPFSVEQKYSLLHPVSYHTKGSITGAITSGLAEPGCNKKTDQNNKISGSARANSGARDC